MTIDKPQLLGVPEFRASTMTTGATNWNWIDPARGHFDQPANYYEATLSPWTTQRTVDGPVTCDVLVIGAGLLGASAALHLVEAGVDTVLIDRHSVGSAASGRNGGQLTPGLARWEAEDLLKNFGLDEAKRAWAFCGAEAMDLIDAIADRYDVDLDRRRGHLTAAIHPGHMSALIEGADARLRLGDDSVSVLRRHELQDHVVSDTYYGAILDRLGGQVHPLALTRTMAHGFAKQGGRLFENSEILRLEENDGAILAHTPGGSILARRGVVIAVHDSIARFQSTLLPTAIPIHTYVSVTKPVPGGVDALLPTGMPVYDTQFQIDYYRPVPDDRILFGGQGTGTNWSAQDVNDYLLGRIRTVFPQYEDAALDFSWSGLTDFTVNGATDCRREARSVPVYMVHGWSGHGVAQTVRIGKAIAEDVVGTADDFEMLLGIEHMPIPLGSQLSPVAIPLAKTAFGMSAAVSPGTLISF